MTTDNVPEPAPTDSNDASEPSQSTSGRKTPPGRRSSRNRISTKSGGEAVMSNSSFVVLLILGLILLAQTIGQLQLQSRNKALLENQLLQQTQAFKEAIKVRQQLESIAGETAILADRGNTNAIRIRASLKEQGINISAPK